LEASSSAYELEAEATSGELSFTLMPFWTYCLGILFNTVLETSLLFGILPDFCFGLSSSLFLKSL
jgi:hypothetical protein